MYAETFREINILYHYNMAKQAHAQFFFKLNSLSSLQIFGLSSNEIIILEGRIQFDLH